MEVAPDTRHHLAVLDKILAAKHGVLDGEPRQETNWILQTQRLFHAGVKIFQVPQHVIREHFIADNLIDFLLRSAELVGVIAQEIVDEAERCAGRLIATAEEGWDLVDDILDA